MHEVIPRRCAAFAALAFLAPAGATAGINLNPSSFSDPSALLESSVVDPIISAIGLMVDNRAYEPATPLGTQVGMDISVQATMIKLPDSFNQALQAAGSSALSVPFVPVAKLNVHKGIGSSVDLGFSGFYYQNIQIYGFDIKDAVYQPEQGPTWAIRLNYTTANFAFADSGASLNLRTQTFKPEILASRKLDFADPYIGVGYQYTIGSLALTLPLPAPLPTLSATSPTARAGAFIGFVGVGLRIPNVGVKVTIDEEYSGVGEDALGVKAGVSF